MSDPKEKKGFEHFIDRFIADGHEALSENPPEEAQVYIWGVLTYAAIQSITAQRFRFMSFP